MKDFTLKTVKSFIVLTLALLTVGSSNLAFANAETKIKDAIDKAADVLKTGVEKSGDKIEEIQHYLKNYDWKGVIQEKASLGPVTVSNIKLNGHHRAVVVKPGERIEGVLKYTLDKDQCKDIKYHRILLGLKGVGPQTTIGTGVGYFVDRENKEQFVIIAPSQPGLYQLRFRPVEGYTEGEALKKWTDPAGQEPSAATTIGFIYVKA